MILTARSAFVSLCKHLLRLASCSLTNNRPGRVLLRIRVADQESSIRRPVREGDRLLVGR